MSTTKTLLMIIFIVILADEHQSHPEIDWFDSINKRLHDSHDVHTAVIIDDPDACDSDILKYELFRKIIGSMSSVTVEVPDGGMEFKLSDFGAVSKLSTSLLFIFYTKYSGDTAQVYRVMHSVSELADFAVNYLLIILRTSSDSTREIEDILRNASNESILKIVIVEIRLTTNSNRFANFCAHSRISNNYSSQVIIHQFNPFMNKTYQKEFSAGMNLFPNFEENMNGYRLNVLFSHQQQYTVVEKNKQKRRQAVRGPNTLLMKTLAEKLNFSVNVTMEPKNYSFFRSNSTVEELVEQFRTLEVDIYVSLSRSMGYIMEESIRSRTIVRRELGILVPKKYEFNRNILKNILESSALTLVIIMIIWFAVILMKFDVKIWQLFSIFSLIITNVVPHKPSKTYERILFLFIAMLGFMYSNDIYGSLTNLGIDHLVEDKYETFEEIDNSGMTPFASTRRSRKIFNDVFGNASNMEKKIMIGGREACVEMALIYRNVCCVMYRDKAEWYRGSSDIKNDRYPLRFAEPILRTDRAAFLFRQGLPGKQKMNQVIERCEETGLLKKMYTVILDSLRHKAKADDKEQLRDERMKTNLLKQLGVVIVFGHSLATLVFIGELLIHRFQSSSKRKCNIHLCGVFKRRTIKRHGLGINRRLNCRIIFRCHSKKWRLLAFDTWRLKRSIRVAP